MFHYFYSKKQSVPRQSAQILGSHLIAVNNIVIVELNMTMFHDNRKGLALVMAA